jgi:hypothetical protein
VAAAVAVEGLYIVGLVVSVAVAADTSSAVVVAVGKKVGDAKARPPPTIWAVVADRMKTAVAGTSTKKEAKAAIALESSAVGRKKSPAELRTATTDHLKVALGCNRYPHCSCLSFCHLRHISPNNYM